MTKQIPDKAEVVVEYPNELYVGIFERTARFDAHLDEAGISLSLYRAGADDERKSDSNTLSLRIVCGNLAGFGEDCSRSACCRRRGSRSVAGSREGTLSCTRM